MMKVFMATLWVVALLLFVELLCCLLSAPDTLMNVGALFLTFGFYALSYHTECFTTSLR